MIMKLVSVALLIALTGFFVAIEFAIVKVRPSRIEQLLGDGKKGAAAAKRVVSHLDEYLSACQLGITVTALGLGWLGEPTVEKLLHPLMEALHLNESLTHILSIGIAFALVTFLHVVAGELAPKTAAIQKAETITLLFATPIIWFYKLMYPFIWVLNSSARMLTRMVGLKPVSEHELAHSEEELRILLSESFKSGEINENEWTYVNNIFEFDERTAKEIMVPRTEMSCLSVDDSLQKVIKTVRADKYTRFPVMNGDKDHIIGVLNVKMFLTSSILKKEKDWTLSSYIQPVIRAIETIPIHDLLVKMQTEHAHMAILMDEYGGTSGLVTVEDILEEIVGEVRDEFDAEEVAAVREFPGNNFVVDAKVGISEVNDLLSTDLSEDGVDTIGGWFLQQNGDVELGAAVEAEGYEFSVEEVDGYHILYLRIERR
ncbi:CBS domain containing-hemolysin-like protein [Bacillus sp. SLBN-46]|uniref:hemolysin family protein n=1 Tax=Bacillus sp. SLBN-46 TaxID=3042283 RepID=UPI0028673EEF|nr:hemolysin family protein [Bacillus sp. SLBN-46]MDR6121013.1 CBS domain containing-hemolysin-like protein [Bacillus sp. SLBN-46]